MKRHAFDAVSFLAGIVLAGLGIAILTERLTPLQANAEWLLPVLALALGAAVLLSIPRADNEESEAQHFDAAPAPAADRSAVGTSRSIEAPPEDERL